MSRYEYKLPRKKQPIFACFKGVVGLFLPKIKVVDLDVSSEPVMFVGNHANKMGPFMYESFLPYYHVKWGAHEMLGNYKQRYSYLRNVLYIQKNGLGKTKATLKAAFEALFSCYVYRGMKIIGTYRDARTLGTVKKTVEVLSAGIPVMVYPEYSDEGYKDVMPSFHPGFVVALESFVKKNGKDIPVRPVYYHKRKRIMVIGKRHSLLELKQTLTDKQQIADFFMEKVNELYYRIENGEFDLNPSK